MSDRDEDSYSFGTDMSSKSGVSSSFDDSAEWGMSRKDSHSQSGFRDTFEDGSFSEQYNGYSDETEDRDIGHGGNAVKKIEGRAASSNLAEKEPVIEPSISLQCGFVGLASFAQGMVIGSLFSVVHKAGSAFSTGVGSNPGMTSSILRSGAADGRTFAIWLASYQSSKCFLRKTRGVDDVYNSFFAGNVAGMVGALKLRNPRSIVISGLVSGVTMAVLDAIQK